DHKSLRVQSLVDRRSRVIASFPGDEEVSSFLVSPDGKRVAYVLARRYENGYACFSKGPGPAAAVADILTTCEMGVLTIATGERIRMTDLRSPNGDVASLKAWSPD